MTAEYIFSGSLPENASTYVTRQADRDLYKALTAGKFCYVLNSRQTGKSSLRVQTMRRLREAGIACAAIDLSFGGTQYVTMEQWYVDMLDTLIESFGLDLDLEEWWEERERLSTLRRFRRFIEEILLAEVCGNIVIFIDEIDSILSLNFPTDDFFAFIRACYQERVNNPEFHRLAFCLLGVATPTSLIQDKRRTPFNIGCAIALKGFQPHEVQPLVRGLQGQVENPEKVLETVLFWTGGQPFLTQKTCHLLASGDPPQPPLQMGDSSLASPLKRGTGGGSETKQEWVERVVRTQIIENWEAQDEPEHLRTIRDRILSNEQRAGRLLGFYQEILTSSPPTDPTTSALSPLVTDRQEELNSDGIPADDSLEQIELRLTGLVIQENGKLQIYNPIYAQVFNWEWVEEILANLRPYAEAIDAWTASDYQDESRLLRGEALQEALVWAGGRNLSEKDFQFLSSSQALDKRETQSALDAEKKARKLEKLEAQEQQRRTQEQLNKLLARQLKISIAGGLLMTILTTLALGFGAWSEFQKRRAAINEVIGLKTSAWALLVSNQEFDATIEALRASKKLKQIAWVKTDVSIPLAVVLQQAIYKVRERNRLERHTGQVSSIKFSPDGQILASASEDNTIKLWNRDGTLRQTLREHTDWVWDVSFSPDGQTFASASEDNTIKLWNRDGTLRQTLREHTDWVWDVNFSPDGQMLASASKDNTIKLWSLDGKLLKTLTGHKDVVYSVNFSPDGQMFASASKDNTIKLWSLDGKLLKTLTGHKDVVYSVNFSPNGQMLASSSKDKTIKLWSLEGTELRTLKGHQDGVYSVNFSPNGQAIASGSADSTVKLWNLEGRLLQTFRGHQGPVWKVHFSPDSQKIASASKDTTVKIWSVEGISPPTFKGHQGVVWAVRFSPDDRTIASASEDNLVKLWSRDGTLLQALKGHSDIVFDISFSPDGQTIASASRDTTIKLWTLTGTLVETLSDHQDRVYSVSFSPDGQTIASASRDKTIKLWHRSGSIIKTLNSHNAPVNWVNFSPDGQMVASASDDRTVKLWSQEGELLKTLEGHTNEVLYVEFSPNGKLIASASRDNTIKLWNANGTLNKTLKGHRGPVMSVTFSSDNQILASASLDKTIKLWNPTNGRELSALKGHQDRVNLVTFSQDNKVLISASSDNTAILWDLDLEKLQQQGCSWLQESFQTNPNLPKDVHSLCWKTAKSVTVR